MSISPLELFFFCILALTGGVLPVVACHAGLVPGVPGTRTRRTDKMSREGPCPLDDA